MIARCTARRLASTAVVLTLGAPIVALGQEVGPYDPLGIRAGSFLIYPSISVSELYDDNVFSDDDNTKSDFITQLSPEVRVESNFSRHRLGLSAGSDIAFFLHQDDENFQDAFISGDGRLDITRQNFIDATVNLARDHQGRDDPEDNANSDLIDLYRYGGSLSFTQLFNRLNFKLTGRARRTDYDESDEADRDEITYDALFRTGFFVSPRINTFVEGRYNIEQRDRPTDFAGIDRDSEGWGVSGGAEVNLTDLIVGEFSVGYRRQSFDEDSFDDQDGIGYGLDLTWTPTQLTTVGLSGSGDFRPTSSGGSGAESDFRSSAGLSISHELLRNVRLNGNLDYVRDDFNGIDRTDDTVRAGAGASYLLTRNFSLNAGYTYSKRWSDLDTEEFDGNVIRVGVTARL